MPLVIVGCCLESDVWAYGLKPQILEVRSRGPGGGGVLSVSSPGVGVQDPALSTALPFFSVSLPRPFCALRSFLLQIVHYTLLV